MLVGCLHRLNYSSVGLSILTSCAKVPGLCLVWSGGVRLCWINFQCLGVLLIWMKVRHGPIVLAVGAGGGCLEIYSLVYHFSILSPILWETARYRLKYCLKGLLNPKQPTNRPKVPCHRHVFFDSLQNRKLMSEYIICT